MSPEPLPPGTLLAERFELQATLGKGPFGIAYLSKDLLRRDDVVVKELAPEGAIRRENGTVDLLHPSAHRLRQRFLEEAKAVGRLNLRGVLPVRAAFGENGTAYYVNDRVPGAVTLDQVLRLEGRLDADGTVEVMLRLADTLEALHAKGIFHRDLRPSNVLVAEGGVAALLDFAAAREWHADAMGAHEAMFGRGYAPPEMLVPGARRGPATDVYGLCATAYHMLTGEPPGFPLRSLREARPDVEPVVGGAIEGGLEPRYVDRPQNMAELRERLGAMPESEAKEGLAELDDRLMRAHRFSFERRGCPACGGVLAEPRPLRKGMCPVCHQGLIRKRDLSERLCPACHIGSLRRRDNEAPLTACPLCQTGVLHHRRKGLLSQDKIAVCQACHARFEHEADGMTLSDAGTSGSEMATGTQKTWDAWREVSGRSVAFQACDSCAAQYDLLPDGRWRQLTPVPRGGLTALYPEEWARVAARLNPGAGNSECDSCGADFDLYEDRLTLLAADNDPHGFAREHLGRMMGLEEARWLGEGKESPHPGLVCERCGTELDAEGDEVRLVHTPNRRLAPYAGEAKRLEDLHRLAQGLPSAGEEESLVERMKEALREAYEAGEVGFDAANETLWKGTATRVDGERSTNGLIVTRTELTFGGLFRRWRVPREEVRSAEAEEGVLRLRLAREPDEVAFEIEPVQLVARMRSGEASVVLQAENLARRLSL